MANPMRFLREVRQQLIQVTWPTRREVLITGIMVLIMVAFLALFFFGADQVFGRLVQYLLTLGS